MARSVYFFGNGKADGTRDMKEVLGGKGANLAEMTSLGVPVPPGFTIATSECVAFLERGQVPEALRTEVQRALSQLEGASGRQFGSVDNPLLVSVRSGAAVSMPGMMETILNLGLNDETVRVSRLRAGTRASPGIHTGDSCRCTPMWCSASHCIGSNNCLPRSA